MRASEYPEDQKKDHAHYAPVPDPKFRDYRLYNDTEPQSEDELAKIEQSYGLDN